MSWSELEKDLNKKVVSSNILLNDFGLADENSRKSGAYTDPSYIPFYYYLGKYVYPKNILELGFGLGLHSGVFLKSCKTVENFSAFQLKSDDFYPRRMAVKNISRVYRNQFSFYIGNLLEISIDHGSLKQLVLVNGNIIENLLDALEVAWQSCALDGLIVVDGIVSKQTVFDDFCISKNRSSFKFNTRYGVGIVQK